MNVQKQFNKEWDKLMDYTYELMKDTNNTHIYIVVHREHPGLNRGQSNLQSDALPLSYTPLLAWGNEFNELEECVTKMKHARFHKAVERSRIHHC